VLTSLSFHRLPDGEPVAPFSCVGSQEKEKDNEENGSVTNCLAQSETTSASPTVGADQPGFRNGSLTGSGIGFWPNRIVLDDDVELGIRSGWASGLGMPKRCRGRATVSAATNNMNFSIVGNCLKILLIVSSSVAGCAQTKATDQQSLPQPGSKQYWLVVDDFADRAVHLAYAQRFAQLHEPLTNRQCQEYSRIAVDYEHQLATVKQAGGSPESGFWNDVRNYSKSMIGPLGVPVPVRRTSNYRVTTGSEVEDRELLRILMLEIDEARSQLLPTAGQSSTRLAPKCRPAIEALTANSGR